MVQVDSFASSGVRRGVVGAGQARALERFGLNHVFTHAFGTSTGAAMLPFFLARQICKHIDIYWKEAASEEFISFKRLFAGERPVEDTEFLSGVFRQKLDHRAAHTSPTEFYVGVTCAETGEGHFLNAKEVRPDMVAAIEASMSIPGLSGKPKKIYGRPWADGAASMGFPAQKIVEEFQPTDLLMLANCSNEEKQTAVGSLIEHLLLARLSRPLRKACFTRYERFAEGVRYLRTQTSCRCGILWSDDQIGLYESDPHKIESAANRADEHFSGLLAEAKAHVEHEYNHPPAAR